MTAARDLAAGGAGRRAAADPDRARRHPGGELAEFIAYAKANQGKMQYGSPGTGSGSHLACALFNVAVQVESRTCRIAGSGLRCRICWPAASITVSLHHDRHGANPGASKSRRRPCSAPSARRPFPIFRPRRSRASRTSTPTAGTRSSCPKRPRPIIAKLNAAVHRRDGDADGAGAAQAARRQPAGAAPSARRNTCNASSKRDQNLGRRHQGRRHYAGLAEWGL